jgi:hypothetical protein
MKSIISGVLRILVAVTIAVAIFISIGKEFTLFNLIEMLRTSPGAFIAHIMLLQFLGSYLIYMITNAIREFRKRPINLKILYIFNSIIILIVNIFMCFYYIKNHDLNHLIGEDWVGDLLSLSALAFVIIDFVPFFIKKNYASNKKSHRFDPDGFTEAPEARLSTEHQQKSL